MIRVGIVGMLGNLGARLMVALSQDPDFEVVFGVVRSDGNLIRALSALQTKPELGDISWAKIMFMSAKHAEVENWNKRQKLVRFIPVDQLSLKKECDVVIDVTNFGCQQLLAQYQTFRGPVILQSEAKEGSLISPPIVNLTESKIYRQGDCLVSALIPILSAFKSIKSVRMHLIKQYGETLGDYPTYQRLNATYLCSDVAKYLAKELSSLLPSTKVNVEGIYQIPGLIYYTASLFLRLKRGVSGDELLATFSQLPRVIVVGNDITSTYDIDYYLRSRLQMTGISIPPIIVYSSELTPVGSDISTEVRLKLAIDYRMIAVLPNIDALRILCLGQEPAEAMRQTDQLAAKLPV